MNLQPIPRPYVRNDFIFTCSTCNTDECDSAIGFADVAAKPGTYVCNRCASCRLGYRAVGRALEARDLSELRKKRDAGVSTGF